MKDYQRILVEAYEKNAAAPYTMSGVAKKLDNVKKYFNAPSRLQRAHTTAEDNARKIFSLDKKLKDSRNARAIDLGNKRANAAKAEYEAKRKIRDGVIIGASGAGAGVLADRLLSNNSKEKTASVQDLLRSAKNMSMQAAHDVSDSASNAGSYLKKQIFAALRADEAAKHAEKLLNTASERYALKQQLEGVHEAVRPFQRDMAMADHNVRLQKLLKTRENAQSVGGNALLGGLLGYLGGKSLGYHTNADYSLTDEEKTASIKDIIEAAKAGVGKAYDATKASAGKAYDATKASATAGANKVKTNFSEAVDAVKKIPSTQKGKERIALGASAAGLGTLGYALGKANAKKVHGSKE